MLDMVARAVSRLVGGVRNGFTMFEQGEGGHDGHDGRPAGVVKYDCLQCKHTPVHKAITSTGHGDDDEVTC